ncbi:MAG: hypothetical protein RJQ14_14240 [Marinoscillum sp.]
MEWLLIVGFILFGTALVVAEILFVPGIFIAGSIGVILSGYGVYTAYESFGNTVGTSTLVAAIFTNVLAIYFSLRGNSWKVFSLKETHESRFNDERILDVKPGDEFRTISVLKPIGKAMHNGIELEVKSSGDYIEENKIVYVSKVDKNLIIVKERK